MQPTPLTGTATLEIRAEVSVVDVPMQPTPLTGTAVAMRAGASIKAGEKIPHE